MIPMKDSFKIFFSGGNLIVALINLEAKKAFQTHPFADIAGLVPIADGLQGRILILSHDAPW